MENNHLSIVKKVFNKKKKITTKLGKKITIRSVKDYDDYKKNRFDLKKTKKDITISRILVLGFAIFLIPLPCMFQNQHMNDYEKVLKQNYEIVKDYNEYNEYYGQYFQSLGIDDNLEIIMKLYHDMETEINNYNLKMENNFDKAYRLAYTYKNGEGVCRHLVDDLVTKIKISYPECNAYSLVVYTDYKEKKDLIPHIKGNHMVAVIEFPGEDYKIIADPTNKFIGAIINGEICIFINNHRILKYQYCPLSQLFSVYDTTINEVNLDLFKSFLNHKNSDEINEIYEKYALGQKEAYQKILQYKSPKEKKERK